MNSYYEQIREATDYIHTLVDLQPQYGIILGTGLGNLTDFVLKQCEIEYKQIPHFPVSTVMGHKGKLIFGWLEGVPVVVMSGRFHYYEGYSMQQVTFPVRVMRALGATKMIVTNVSGSTNSNIEAGDIALIKDHINLLPENPLRGTNDPALGVRFPDMMDAYDAVMRKKVLEMARHRQIKLHEAVYIGLQGPNLETPAEYRFLHAIGGDLVGMSTIPEVIVARHCGLRVLALSVVSNKCYPTEDLGETTLESVIAVANAAEPKLTAIVKWLMANG